MEGVCGLKFQLEHTRLLGLGIVFTMLLDFIPEFAKLGKVSRKPRWIANHKIPRDSLQNLEDQASVFDSSHGLLPAFGLSVVLQNEDALRFVGTVHLLSLRDHLLLKLHVLTLIHTRTRHLHLHLVNLRLGDFTSNLTRLRTLEFDQAVMAFAVGGSHDNAVRRGSEKRLLAMTYARDILDCTRGVQLVLLLGNGLQNGAPHQRIVQEIAIASLSLRRCEFSHHNLLSSGRRSIHHITDFARGNHGGPRIVPRICALLFVALLLDDPPHIAVADPLSRFLHVPGLGELLVGLAVGGSGTTCQKCKFLHLLANVGAFPLVGVEKQSELIHQYPY